MVLGSQLGVGAYRALAEKGLSRVMISVERQFDLRYVNFDELIDPETLVTVVRYIETDSDFHQLARLLETHVEQDLARIRIGAYMKPRGRSPSASYVSRDAHA